MIVCHCWGVRDRDIRRAVREGALTPRAVARSCGAGTGCGGCRVSVRELIDDERTRAEADEPTAAFDLTGFAAAGR
jgi:bacterioferritin-associated ferredoxin